MTDHLFENAPSLSRRQIQFIRSLAGKKVRDQSGQFFIEGVRICEEAYQARAAIAYAVACPQLISERGRALLASVELSDIPIHRVSASGFKSLSSTRSPQGIGMVVSRMQPHLNPGPIIMALDHIRDPGNIGTLFRTADWFGISSIILSQGCVDVYNDKVVRSSMGAIFKVPFTENADLIDICNQMKTKGYVILGTAANADTSLVDFQNRDKILCALGSEAEGLSPPLLNSCDAVISIPGNGKSDSLNAAIAGSILMYHLTLERS
ncbi:MAG: RNA methyltransferase [candidate division KSB1 bacterium]|nr:RNA methyltransferase [candidate division KSB1 bacterium]